jgi:cytochrome c-type biogenesis protein CcmH/NrfF
MMDRVHPFLRIEGEPMLRMLFCFLVVVVPGGLVAAPAGAQIPAGVEGSYEPHPEARRAISKLLSPYCPGFMLEVCPSSEAQALRDSIHARALQGASSDELVEWMLADYGEEYRAVPQSRGSGLFAWILPPLALLLGGLGVVMALRRFRPVPEHTAAATAPGKDTRLRSPDDPSGQDDLRPRDDLSVRDDPLSPETEARLREAIRELELSEDPL